MSEIKLQHARIIGEKLRIARQSAGISLRGLAKKAEMSASMLSQIETGKAYPSVRSIYDIAAALDLPVDHFFPGRPDERVVSVEKEHSPKGSLTASEMREATIGGSNEPLIAGAIRPGSVIAQVVHASARPTIVLKGGVTWTRLTATAEPGVEFLEISYASGATSGENLSHHAGRDFGLILEGELVVQRGDQDYVLCQGDSIVFDSTIPHRLVNKGKSHTRAIWVVWHVE
ncbi:MAG: cupin domain-containing protein [Anaerolineae bacterium]